MFLWIDPPGPDAGWVHELTDWDQIPEVLALYPDIPEDNNARKLAYDENPVGARGYWGITAMYQLPVPMPDGAIMVGPEQKDGPP